LSGDELDTVSTVDNCAVVSISNNINDSTALDGEELTSDTTDVVWIVTDKAGNEAQCSFDVIISVFTSLHSLQQQLNKKPCHKGYPIARDYCNRDG